MQCPNVVFFGMLELLFTCQQEKYENLTISNNSTITTIGTVAKNGGFGSTHISNFLETNLKYSKAIALFHYYK